MLFFSSKNPLQWIWEAVLLLVIGIDIAQQTRAVNFRGIAIGNPHSFSNDEEEFHSFLQWMQSIQAAHSLTEAIVGMEPTSHYWLNVSRWLSEQQFEVVLVNPHLVKKNKENRDNTPSKSDKKDALVIADMVKNGHISFIRNTPEAYDLTTEQLKTVETEIFALLDRIPFAKSMLAVKGISAISLAAVLGEAGDLSGFAHGNALLRHAGLNLAEASSGNWTRQMKISKHGRSCIRRFIFMLTMSLVVNNQNLKKYMRTMYG